MQNSVHQIPPREWEASQVDRLWGERVAYSGVPACRSGRSRVLSLSGGWAGSVGTAYRTASHCRAPARWVWGEGQAPWFHRTLGSAVRMCLVGVSCAWAWRLGTLRSVPAGTGCKHRYQEPGMLLSGNADPFHTRIHTQPCTRSQVIPGTPNSPGTSHMEGITPGSPALLSTCTLPRLPVPSPRPDLDGARRPPAGCLPTSRRAAASAPRRASCHCHAPQTWSRTWLSRRWGGYL